MQGVAPWIGVGISASILCLVVFNNHVRPWLHARKMRHPYSAWFRGAGDGKPREVTLPAHSDCHIQINRDVFVSHAEQELIAYFNGTSDQRPEFLGTQNAFMARGIKKERSPETDETEYVSDKGGYHIQRPRMVSKGNTYSTGYLLRTKAPGRYRLKIMTMTESGEGNAREDLTVIVQ